jgi:hypothetical protein
VGVEVLSSISHPDACFLNISSRAWLLDGFGRDPLGRFGWHAPASEGGVTHQAGQAMGPTDDPQV